MKKPTKFNILKFLILIAIGVSSFLYVFGSGVFAQTPTAGANYDVTVSPVFLDLKKDPGQTINTKIRIRNNTNSPLPLKLEVKKLTGDTNGDLVLRDTSSDDSLSWISFDNGDTIVANPLEWTDVPITITIPKDAAYGYYFAISFTQDNNSPLKRTGAAITGAAAVPILLTVNKPGAKAEAQIVDFSTTKGVYEYLPVDFNVVVENSGNVHILPHGNIFISDAANKDVATLDVNPAQGNIIPSTKRTFTPGWDDGFLVRVPLMENGKAKLDKNGNPETTLQINWNKLTSFRVGKYTANLILVFDNGTRDVSLSKTISFWVIPYKALLVIFISIVILVILIRFLLKYYINREVKRRLKD